MDEEEGFRAVLTTANFGARPRNAIIDFCCETLRELAHLPRSELNTSLANMHKAMANLPNAAHRVRLNATKITLLHAIGLHFLDRIKCNSILDLPEVSALLADDIQEMRAHYNESQLLNTPDGLSSIVVPKLKSNTWSEFKSAIIETLSRSKGRNEIPLSYVIREDDVGDFAESYDSREERLVSCITHRGPAYKSDNSDVFSILLQNTENTEGYSLIEAQGVRRNGRQAWLDILSHFEGETFKERVAQEANTILRTVMYHGPRKNFSFGDFYARHSRAHIKLLKANKPMTVQQQIDTFIAGIKCATAQAIVVNISGDSTIRTSFDTYYNAIASKLELALQLTNQISLAENRNVNKFESSKYKNKRRYDRGNDTRNSKRGKGGDPNQNFTPELKVYSPTIWKKLSKENQAKVKSLYLSQNRTNRHQGSTNNHQMNRGMVPFAPPTNRNVAQVGFYNNQMDMQTQYPYSGMHGIPRAINQVLAPPLQQARIPGPPPPPPQPPSQNQHPGNETISGNAGDMGQYFGGYSNHF